MKYKNITITSRKDNRWQAKIPLGHSRYKFIYGKTQIDCYNLLKAEFRDNINIKYIQMNSLKLNDWYSRWIELYKKNKIKTSSQESIEIVFRKYVLPIIGAKDITKIKTLDIEILLNNITSSRQCEKTYTYLNDCFKRAFKNKLVKENPLEYIDKPKHRKAIGSALDWNQEKIFLNNLYQTKHANIYLLLLYQGLRIGEALALTNEDFDFEKKTLTINKGLAEDGKIISTKTESSMRIIPLFDKTINKFKSIVTALKKTNQRLFNIQYPGVYKDFTIFMQSIKLEKFTMHSLRHTFITRCIEKGVSSKVVQKWVGHSSNKITEEVYTHINSDFEAKERLKIDTRFDTEK